MHRYATILTLLAASFAARAEDAPPPPAEIAAARTHNQGIVARSPDAAGVFAVQDDGTIKHVQSGLVCAAKYPNLDFWHAEVFDGGKGYDVGCDYGRNGTGGQWVSKLTIFAVKQADGETLDQAFARYRTEITSTYPDAVSNGPAFKIKTAGDGARSTLPEIRSEEFVHPKDGAYWTETLLVFVRKGWVLEIRGTYQGKPNDIEISKNGGVDEAANAMGDRLVLIRAALESAATLGE